MAQYSVIQKTHFNRDSYVDFLFKKKEEKKRRRNYIQICQFQCYIGIVTLHWQCSVLLLHLFLIEVFLLPATHRVKKRIDFEFYQYT